jgi:hypothetical protein
LAAPKHIQIGDLSLFVAYSPSESTNQLKEYLPEGEKFEDWKRLASVRTFATWKDPELYLKQLGPWIVKKDPASKYRLFQKKDGPLVLDFFIYAYKDGKVSILEWNLMKAHYEEGRGVILDQYAMRIYNPDTTAFDAITAERKKMLNPFADATFVELE